MACVSLVEDRWRCRPGCGETAATRRKLGKGQGQRGGVVTMQSMNMARHRIVVQETSSWSLDRSDYKGESFRYG